MEGGAGSFRYLRATLAGLLAHNRAACLSSQEWKCLEFSRRGYGFPYSARTLRMPRPGGLAGARSRRPSLFNGNIPQQHPTPAPRHDRNQVATGTYSGGALTARYPAAEVRLTAMTATPHGGGPLIFRMLRLVTWEVAEGVIAGGKACDG